MNLQERGFLKILKLLSDNNCLENVVLIGSWAEYLYKQTGILPEYNPNLRTLDVDFLIKNMRKPNQKIGLTSLAREEGFLVDEDVLTGVTKIYDENGLEVEFLLAKRGQGKENALKTNLGVTAQTLHHLDVLSRNLKQVEYLGMTVELPKPEAFVLHKMIINDERKSKKEKDQNVIKDMFEHIDKKEFELIKKTLTKKELAKVQNYMDKVLG